MVRLTEVPSIGPASRRSGDTSRQAAPRIGILLLGGFCLTSFASFMDVFRLAGKGQRQPKLPRIMTPGARTVRSSCGVGLSGNALPGRLTGLDYLVVFSGMPGQRSPMETATKQFLQGAVSQNLSLVGIGGGVASLLDSLGRDLGSICVHWDYHDDFIELFGELTLDPESLFQDHGAVITCAGGVASLDLALYLVRRHHGNEVGREIQQSLLYERSRPPHELQSVPTLARSFSCEVTRRAVRMMERNYSEMVDIEAMALKFNLSRRQLERRFRREMGKGIHEFLRELRLSNANSHILHSSSNILKISLDSGFGSVENFNHAYKSHFGCTPTEMRQRQKTGNG